VDSTTVCRWVQRSAPQGDKRCRPSLRALNAAYRVADTYIPITKPWDDLSRAVDSAGAPLDFMRSASRAAVSAAPFFRKVLGASHPMRPRVMTDNKTPASPPAVAAPQHDSIRPETCRLRPRQSLTTAVEQAPRLVKRRVHPGLGCGAFHTAQRTRQGDEARYRLRKGQLAGLVKGEVGAQHRAITQRFGLGA
jgi:transposase-like protein